MANNFPVEDRGILAVQDDGSPEGILKVKIEQGEIVKIPINNFITASEIQVVQGGSGSAFPSYVNWTNGDGTASGLNLNTVSAGLGSNFVLLNTVLKGKVIGIRFRRNTSTPEFSVVIDGIPYDCPTRILRTYTGNTMSISGDRESMWIVADDLSDGEHTVQIFLYPSAIATKTFIIYGFLLEKRIGYKEVDRVNFISGSGTLTASSVDVPKTDFAIQAVKSIKSIIYQNTDTVARIVTLNYNNIAIAKIYLSASGTNGDSYKYDFGEGVNIGGSTANLAHLADLTAKVNFVVIAKS